MAAVLSVALLSSLALAVDVGAGYVARRALQTSVDAAALAAAQDVAEGKGVEAARATAAKYVADNGGLAGRTSVSFPGGSNVRVETAVDQTTFFARLFGRESFEVKTGATASIAPAGRVENLVPIIVPRQSVEGHIGPANQATYELGEDRPLDNPSITYTQSGSVVTYTVAYSNTCAHVADLDMSSSVPRGAEYVAGSVTGGGTVTGNTVRWAWTGVASGDRRSASFSVRFTGAGGNPANEVTVKVSGPQMTKTLTGSTTNAQRGFFWLVDFDGGNHATGEFADWIVNGYPNPVGVGDLANGTGVRAALKTAMAARLANDPKVVLPLYDYTEGGGNGSYHVVGFAEFALTDFDLTGNPKAVKGYFTNGTVTAGSASGGSAPDYGVRVIWLSD